MFIYKDPKTDKGNLKKSHKGCCQVVKWSNGNFTCLDEHTEWVDDSDTCLETVFKDGMITKFQTLEDIRNVLHGGTF